VQLVLVCSQLLLDNTDQTNSSELRPNCERLSTIDSEFDMLN
jgi:hypothetical protein